MKIQLGDAVAKLGARNPTRQGQLLGAPNPTGQGPAFRLYLIYVNNIANFNIVPSCNVVQ